MFHSVNMQHSFDFVRPDIAGLRRRLGPAMLPSQRRQPIGQLVYSMISGRTRDPVSLAAYRSLAGHYHHTECLARADEREVAQVIAPVTFAEKKSEWLIAAMNRIAEEGDFTLERLSTSSLAEAIAWLETLPGVGRKVAAATLNASTLARPVMIVDTHVLRVARRLGLVSARADYRAASEVITAAMPNWLGDDFLSLHVALKHLGRTVCRWDVPACAACPLAMECPTAQLIR